jgi:hypothetical protein
VRPLRARAGSGASRGFVMAALGDTPAGEVTTHEVEDPLRSAAATGVRPRTVNKVQPGAVRRPMIFRPRKSTSRPDQAEGPPALDRAATTEALASNRKEEPRNATTARDRAVAGSASSA